MALAGTALFAGMIPVTALGLPGNPPVVKHPVQQSDLSGNKLWAVSTPKRFVPTDRNSIGLAKASDAAFTLPFNDNFSDGDATRERYTVIDVDGDGSGDGNSVKNRWFWKEDESLIQFCTDNNAPGNDWLITPAIHLDGKNIYNLEIVVNMGAPSNLKLTVGTSTDPATHREIMDLNGIEGNWQTAYKHDFSVGEEGDYYIGFYNYSGKDSFYFNLFSISVTAGISSLIPEAPGDFTAVAGEKGLLETNLSMTVPKALANGTPLTDELDLVIERNEERIYEAKAVPGSLLEWTDKTPSNGENTYKVYALYDGAVGLTAEKTLWVGTDIPKAPSLTEIKTTDRNMKVRIEWTAVNSGMHDDVYFNPDNITYAVYRGYSSKEMSPIAVGLKDNVYVDSEIASELGTRQDSYFYAVAACNEAGATNSSAEIIAVGKPYEVPQHESFAYGQLELSPWLTDPISGSFSWECIHDENGGVASQDGDNGLTRFYAVWGGDTDSRLKSPVFDLSTADKPMLSFYMFHWEESSVAADYGATRLVVEVSRDGGPFEAIADPLLAGYSQYGWVEHRFSLEDFKDAETVQFGFRGQTDNSWMYYYIDNIRVEECLTNDIAIEDFYGPSTMSIDEQAVFTLKYLNRGTEKAENYSINLYRDDKLVASYDGETLEPGESKYVGLGFTMNAAQVFDLNEFRAEISYSADENTDNNVSSTVNPTKKSSKYPRVTDLTGEVTDGKAALSWSAPELPGLGSIVDGAEDYDPFATEGFGDWTTYDGDGLTTGYYTDLPEWPGRGGRQAFSVWAPYELDGFGDDGYHGYLIPYAGQKCFIAWLVNEWNDFDTPPVNDDYLISPEVTGGTEVSMMVSCINSTDTEETYELMYSTTGTSVDDFTLIEKRVAQHEWEKVTFTLPDDARFFCIRYTGSDQMGLMVDDISYVPVAASLKVLGYNVFRNGEKINDALVEDTEFTDSTMPEGESAYRVAVVYDKGTSNASRGLKLEKTGIGQTVNDGCTIEARDGVVSIDAAQPTAVSIYGIDGKTVVNTTVNGHVSFNLPGGFYLIRAGEKTVKVAL